MLPLLAPCLPFFLAPPSRTLLAAPAAVPPAVPPAAPLAFLLVAISLAPPAIPKTAHIRVSWTPAVRIRFEGLEVRPKCK